MVLHQLYWALAVSAGQSVSKPNEPRCHVMLPGSISSRTKRLISSSVNSSGWVFVMPSFYTEQNTEMPSRCANSSGKPVSDINTNDSEARRNILQQIHYCNALVLLDCDNPLWQCTVLITYNSMQCAWMTTSIWADNPSTIWHSCHMYQPS